MHLLDNWYFIAFFFQTLLHLFIYCVFTCLHVYACMCHSSHTWKLENNLQIQFSPFIRYVLGTELRPSDLVASTFAHWGISPTLRLYYFSFHSIHAAHATSHRAFLPYLVLGELFVSASKAHLPLFYTRAVFSIGRKLWYVAWSLWPLAAMP